MVSKQVVYIAGIELHVFGLEEYKNLPTGTPLCAMFFSTSVQSTQEYIERACHQMCTLNEKRKPNDRYLIIISLDHPNVGTRTAHRDDTMQKLHVYDMDMMRKVYVNGKVTAFNIISIIECFDIYVFGEDSDAHVEKWGMVGFSMGAFTTAIAASVEPRLEAVVMIASSLHYKLWLKHIGYRVGVGEDFVKKRRTIKMIDEGLENIFNDLSHTKVLILNGDQDDRICLATENETIKEFRQAHKGREGVDWDYMTLPVKGHRLSSAYVVQAMKWAQKWVTSKTEFIEAKL